MTKVYKIYLCSEKTDKELLANRVFVQMVDSFSEKTNAMLVAKSLEKLIMQGMITYIYNDFHETYDFLQVEEYSLDTGIGKVIYSTKK